MKIHFSKKEYRLLLDMIQILGWVLNAHSVDKEDFQATEHYQAFSQKIKAYAKEAGCEDFITFDKTLEQYFATYEYEMEGKYMEFVKAFLITTNLTPLFSDIRIAVSLGIRVVQRY